MRSHRKYINRVAWSALPRTRQLWLLRIIVRSWSRSQPPDFKIWSVIGTGYGYRVKESRGKVVRRTPVLSLIVAKKIALAPDARQRIPTSWTHVFRDRSCRVVVQIPIDVCEMPVEILAHAGPAPALAVSGNATVSDGTACVILKNVAGSRWLLSCHHVIGRSGNSPHLAPDSGAKVEIATVHGIVESGVRRRFGFMQDASEDCVDAALASLPGRVPINASSWEIYPSVQVTEGDYLGAAAGRVRAVTRRAGNLLRLAFVRFQAQFPMDYSAGAVAFLKEVALFEILPGSGRTAEPGDSGSMIVTTAGEWLGMHIGEAFIRSRVTGAEIPVSVVLPPHVICTEEGVGDAFGLSRT